MVIVLLINQKRDVIRLHQPQRRLLLFDLVQVSLLNILKQNLSYLLLKVELGLEIYFLARRRYIPSLIVITVAVSTKISPEKLFTLLLGHDRSTGSDLGVDDDRTRLIRLF